jgi:hypothetical protein
MRTCKHCNKSVSENHYCAVAQRDIAYVEEDDGFGDFLISAAIGAATDSALLGGLLGGDVLGAIVGDMLDGDLFD